MTLARTATTAVGQSCGLRGGRWRRRGHRRRRCRRRRRGRGRGRGAGRRRRGGAVPCGGEREGAGDRCLSAEVTRTAPCSGRIRSCPDRLCNSASTSWGGPSDTGPAGPATTSVLIASRLVERQHDDQGAGRRASVGRVRQRRTSCAGGTPGMRPPPRRCEPWPGPRRRLRGTSQRSSSGSVGRHVARRAPS
jgi:hypothetical protein